MHCLVDGPIVADVEHGVERVFGDIDRAQAIENERLLQVLVDLVELVVILEDVWVRLSHLHHCTVEILAEHHWKILWIVYFGLLFC